MTHLLPPPLLNRVHNLDAMELMRLLPAKSVDAIITDLPYGTTACSWDEIIPFAPMWSAVKRVLKPRGVFVTTASQPFTSKLIMSNVKAFRYEWVWLKPQGSNFLDVNRKPFKAHESVLIFGYEVPIYYPQMSSGKPYRTQTDSKTKVYGKFNLVETVNYGERYPLSYFYFGVEDNGFHTTQKPVALYEYLISTYTQAGETVLDFCCGSGTTAVSARNLKRNYIVGDTSAEYCDIARERLKTEFGSRNISKSESLEDLPMFRGEKLFRPAS